MESFSRSGLLEPKIETTLQIVSILICWAAKGQLPYARDQAVPGGPRVLLVSRKFLREELLFVPNPGNQDGDQRQGGDHRPPGAQRHRREDEHDKHPEVHGMSDDRIRAGHDDALTLLHLDDAGRVAVFPQHQDE